MSVLVVLVLASDQKEQDWRDFAAEHCKVIEKREGATTTGVGVSLKGQAGVLLEVNLTRQGISVMMV
ncbi:hypothetical protein [Klebsiella pneumoniae]|uniref:hypothetical protein n=1 Tax=Klebsiella pneumoniae TaxID=573 RepID=UPI001D18A5DA|nr:hypothetical protein [Klebsiella pneumoniae]